MGGLLKSCAERIQSAVRLALARRPEGPFWWSNYKNFYHLSMSAPQPVGKQKCAGLTDGALLIVKPSCQWSVFLLRGFKGPCPPPTYVLF